MEFPFHEGAVCVANRNEKQRWNLRYQEILQTEGEKKVARWSVYWLFEGAFSILITHAGRPEEMEGVTSLAAHRSYFAALCASLKFLCSNTYLRAVLQWSALWGLAYAMTTCCFQKKYKKKRKGKKKGRHFSGSRFECSVNDNVTLNTQFSIRWSCCIFDDSVRLL